VAFNRALLPKLLSALPGGGLAQNSILEVEDQEQRFNAQLVIALRVSERAGRQAGRQLWLLRQCCCCCRPPHPLHCTRHAAPPRLLCLLCRRTGMRSSTPRALS
jgi:hypothetical protein